MYDKLAIATLLFAIGHSISWFTWYAQFIWKWANDHPFTVAILAATPATFCFMYGIRYAFEFFESGWGPRFHVFSVSFIVMPILFWYFMNESFFTLKNLLSVVLAVLIIYIQMRFK